MAEDKKIEISENELKRLVEQNQEFVKLIKELNDKRGNQEVEGGVITKRQGKRRTVRVMFLDGKPVVGMKNMGTDRNPVKVYEVADPRFPDRKHLETNLLLLDLEKEIIEELPKVNFIEFIQGGGEVRECTIVKVDEEKWEQQNGVTAVTKVEDYATVVVGETEAFVGGSYRTYHVENEGKVFMIHEDYVNMK